MRLFPRLLVLFTGAAVIHSCGGGASSEGPTGPETAVPSNITLSPPSATLNTVGATVQFTATVRDQRGREMTGQTVSWSSTAPDAVTVSSSGLAMAVADGTGTIVATVSGGVSGWANVTVEVVELTITTSALAVGTTGQPYDEAVEATVLIDQSWSVTNGVLPPGLSLDSSSGTITGTPTIPGVYTFTLQVDVPGQTASQTLSITVVSGELGIGFDDDQFVLIQAGSFQMGSTNGASDERPVHQVNITQPFYLQKTEVTQAQWVEIMGTNPSSFSNCGDTCPVERVSYAMVQAFIQALNNAYPGKNFRLPTEAEWEYAARAGTTTDYAGTGNLEDMGWYSGNSASRTHFVGLKQANAWGLFDVHGNVYEWVADWYQSDYYTTSPSDDPPGPPGGNQRVMRGGSVDRGPDDARSANRSRATPTQQGFTIYYGLRLARTPEG